MTKEEKAKELFNKYYSYLKANLMYDEEAREDAKQCALIAVDEILKVAFYSTDEIYNYYLEVKQEIEKPRYEYKIIDDLNILLMNTNGTKQHTIITDRL